MAERLHEIGGDVTPELTNRVASGKAGTPTVNSTWQTIVTWLEGVLGFLKTTENLNDLNNTTTARTNLGVYSTTQTDGLLADKADTSNVLEKDNTTTYTPTSDYNPTTKKYVDESRGVLAYCAIITFTGTDGTNIARTEKVNNSFINTINVSSSAYSLVLQSANANASTEYEIYATPYPDSNLSSRSTNILFPVGGSEIEFRMKNSDGNNATDSFCIRIYDWS